MKRKKNRPQRPPAALASGPAAASAALARAAAPSEEASNAGTLEQARQLIALGRQDQALSLLAGLSQGQPPDPQALSALGRLYMDRQEYSQAASVFRRLCGLMPREAGPRNSLAMALVMAGQPADALPEMQEAVRLAPREAVFVLNLGKLFVMRQEWGPARQVLAGLWDWVPEALRDQTLGYLNQCLAQLGQPLINAAPAAEAVAQAPAPAPSPAPAAQVRPVTAAAPGPAPAMDMLLCCAPGTDSFVGDMIKGLAPRVRVEKLVSGDGQEIVAAMARHQTIWIEWGNELAEFLTKQAAPALKGKRVILRIHAYEVMTGLAERIDFSQVTDLMFVCAGMRDILLARRPEIRRQVERIHVIPNGIDLERFSLQPRPAGLEIAYVGYLNFKKGPMVLMHALQALHRRDARVHLHVAGIFQDFYSETACRHFLAQNNLEGAVRFHGWVKDIENWLCDKQAIICTSLSESQGLGLMEALARGLKPLIYNFHTAEQIYPRQWLWNNLEELCELIYEPHDPELGRRFVEQNYSLDLQVERLNQMLFEGREVVFAGPQTEVPGPPPTPAQCFSEDLPQRMEANKRQGQELKQQGRLKQATVFLERAWSQSRYQDRQAAQDLLDCHLKRARYHDLARVFRETGLAAAGRGDYGAMLSAFYEVYYYAYKYTGSYRWQHFDPAIETVLRLVADKVEPLAGHDGLADCLDPDKLKVVLVLESFDLSWATVKRFVDIGRRLDKSRFEVIYLTRMEMQDAWRPVLEELMRHGCHLLWGPGQDYYAKTRQFIYILRKVGADVLMMNTQFLTPWYDLLALSGAARRVVKFLSQGGGLETSPDLVVSTVGGALADEVAPGAYLGPAYVSEIARRRAGRVSPAGQLKAVCVGRPVKFYANHRFWKVLRQSLGELPGLSIDIVGSTAQEVFGSPQSPLQRLNLLGFRQDVQELLAGYDVLIDTWPSGGGCTVREAHAAGLPVISWRTPWHEHYQEGASFYGGLDDFIHPELRLERFANPELTQRLGRLANDLEYYGRIQRECNAIPVLTPEQFVERLAQELLRLCGRDAGGR